MSGKIDCCCCFSHVIINLSSRLVLFSFSISWTTFIGSVKGELFRDDFILNYRTGGVGAGYCIRGWKETAAAAGFLEHQIERYTLELTLQVWESTHIYFFTGCIALLRKILLGSVAKKANEVEWTEMNTTDARHSYHWEKWILTKNKN